MTGGIWDKSRKIAPVPIAGPSSKSVLMPNTFPVSEQTKNLKTSAGPVVVNFNTHPHKLGFKLEGQNKKQIAGPLLHIPNPNPSNPYSGPMQKPISAGPIQPVGNVRETHSQKNIKNKSHRFMPGFGMNLSALGLSKENILIANTSASNPVARNNRVGALPHMNKRGTGRIQMRAPNGETYEEVYTEL